jgi:hypothetical protein
MLGGLTSTKTYHPPEERKSKQGYAMFQTTSINANGHILPKTTGVIFSARYDIIDWSEKGE